MRIKERRKRKMKKLVLAIVPVLLLAMVLSVSASAFDEFGYNYQAMVFVGKADGVDRNLDGTVWGDATYANDHLVMKWSKAWNDSRFHGVPWTPEAWETNEWNGAIPGGSGEVWHYKIVWFGNPSGLPEGTYLADGGYVLWTEFEVLMDQGISDGLHSFLALAKPNGFGS